MFAFSAAICADAVQPKVHRTFFSADDASTGARIPLRMIAEHAADRAHTVAPFMLTYLVADLAVHIPTGIPPRMVKALHTAGHAAAIHPVMVTFLVAQRTVAVTHPFMRAGLAAQYTVAVNPIMLAI